MDTVGSIALVILGLCGNVGLMFVFGRTVDSLNDLCIETELVLRKLNQTDIALQFKGVIVKRCVYFLVIIVSAAICGVGFWYMLLTAFTSGKLFVFEMAVQSGHLSV